MQSIDIFVEEEAEASIVRVYELFELGETPQLIDLPDDLELILSHLEEAQRAGKTVGLFGADEGVPVLCDPGWRLLMAAQQLDTPMRVRSISAGSALSTALMYADVGEVPFTFLGLCQPAKGHCAFIRALGRVTPFAPSPALISFTNGADLVAVWSDLVEVANLVRVDVLLDEPHATMNNPPMPTWRLPIKFSRSGDKIVLRVDLNKPGH